jgi:hypothetical protein
MAAMVSQAALAVVETAALGSVTAAEPLPGALGQARRQLVCNRPLDHQPQERRLRREGCPCGNLRGDRPLLVVGPGAGQVELPVDQRPALLPCIGQEPRSGSS